MSKAISFVFACVFVLIGASVEAQVTKFPAAAAGAGASYDQDLNTTDNVTFADVTLTDDLILGATSVIQTPTVAGATMAEAITIEAGSTGDQQGGALNLFAGASTTAGGGTVLIIAGSSAGDGGGGTAALRAGNNGAATGGDVSAGGAGVGGASGNFQLYAGQSAGTDLAGSDSEILGGGSTGSGVGGVVLVKVTPPGASSAVANVHAEVFRVDHLGVAVTGDATLTDDLILGSSSIIQTPDSVSGDAIDLQMVAGLSTDGEGGAVTIRGSQGSTYGGQVTINSGSGGDGIGGQNASLLLRGGEPEAGGYFVLGGGGAVGTNIAGSNSEFQGTGSTGNAVGGAMLFLAAAPGASGVDGNALAEVFRVDHLGVMFSKVYTTAPAAGDCNDAAETGRVAFDSTADNLYICSGASGWRKIATAAP